MLPRATSDPPQDPRQQMHQGLVSVGRAADRFRSAHQAFTSDFAQLYREGFDVPPEVIVNVEAATADRLCLSAIHVDAPDTVFFLDTDTGTPSTEPCQ